jgi:hypothetical protein
MIYDIVTHSPTSPNEDADDDKFIDNGIPIQLLVVFLYDK